MGCCGDACVSYDMQPGLLCWCFHNFCCFLGRYPPWVLLYWIMEEKGCHASLLDAFIKGVYDFLECASGFFPLCGGKVFVL